MRTLEKYANLNLIWVFPIIVPLGTILLSFYLQEWYWGLMDDHSILGSGNNFTERLSYFYRMLGGGGLFRPTYGLHSVVFYSLFEYTPVLMHVLELNLSPCPTPTEAYRLCLRIRQQLARLRRRM